MFICIPPVAFECTSQMSLSTWPQHICGQSLGSNICDNRIRKGMLPASRTCSFLLKPTEVILQIKRTRRTSLHCCRLSYAGSEVALEMRQSRSISMRLRSIGNAHAMFDMKMMLLHPKDTLCSVKLSFSGIITDSVQLTNSEGLKMNWSPDSFENYCSNGCFFIAVAGRLVSEN